MRYLTIVLSAVLLYGVAKSQSFDPYSAGPYSTDKQLISRYFTFLTWWYPGLKYELEVIVPDAAGTYPVVYFLGGYGAVGPAGIYDIILKRIASHGYVVVHLWKVSAASFASKVDDLDSSITWITNHLRRTRVIRWNDITLDFDLSFGIGFSLGGRILTEYLEVKGCNDIKGIVLLSPVDSFLPITGDPLITDGTSLSFDTPTLILAAGYDNAGDGPTAIPEDSSNYHFYDAIDTPYKWIINATEYGHSDFLDPGYLIIAGIYDSSIAYAIYRSYVSGQAIALFEGLQAAPGPCEAYFDYLEDPSMIPITVEDPIEFVHASLTCPAPYCTHSG